MVPGVHFANDLLDDSLFIDDVRDPRRTHILPSVHGLLYPCSVLLVNVLIRISQKAEWKFFLLDKLLVRPFIVGTDPKDFISRLAGNGSCRAKLQASAVQTGVMSLG